jgi:ubiquinone biosynthesis monooxygenase Coq6
VWDGISDARITFHASELGNGESSQMAFLTENINLQRALLRRLSGVREVQILDSVKVDSIQKDNKEHSGWPLVHLSDGKVLRTRLLVIIFNIP